MNDEPHTPRPRRAASSRHQTSQLNASEIGGQRSSPKARKSGIDHLLEIGRTRDIPCVTDKIDVNAVFTRRILIHRSGKIVNAIFVYPITEDADFDEGKAWMDRFWPIAEGQADA